MTRGRFVVLEGGDGSGKSTQAARLACWLRGEGLTVHETFEPGAGATGAVIRELLLHGTDTIAPMAEALLMAADRAQHVATEIEPADEGPWRALFRLHAERGDRVDLMREDRRMRQALRDMATELGESATLLDEDVSPELVQEYQRLLAGLHDAGRASAAV